MYINSNYTHNFGGFEIETGKIKMRSASKKTVELPYTGDLPDDLKADTAAARIGVYVATTRTPAAVLILTDHKGREQRHTLHATDAELEEILQRFFFNANGGTRFDGGLTEYWTGFAQAHFLAWQALRRRPQDILKIIPQDKQRSA